jgi:hypothetical protein
VGATSGPRGVREAEARVLEPSRMGEVDAVGDVGTTESVLRAVESDGGGGGRIFGRIIGREPSLTGG